jgi:hypothetical protein
MAGRRRANGEREDLARRINVIGPEGSGPRFVGVPPESVSRLLSDLERAEAERDALMARLATAQDRIAASGVEHEISYRQMVRAEQSEARLSRVVEIASCYRADEWAWEMAPKILAAAKGER